MQKIEMPEHKLTFYTDDEATADRLRVALTALDAIMKLVAYWRKGCRNLTEKVEAGASPDIIETLALRMADTQEALFRMTDVYKVLCQVQDQFDIRPPSEPVTPASFVPAPQTPQ